MLGVAICPRRVDNMSSAQLVLSGVYALLAKLCPRLVLLDFCQIKDATSIWVTLLSTLFQGWNKWS